MQSHTARVELEADGTLVLHDLPFQQGDVVEVSVLGVESFARLTPEQMERSRAIRASLRGRVTFADDFDPEAPACPPEDWEAVRGVLDPEAPRR